jgi:hypothetical protein
LPTVAPNVDYNNDLRHKLLKIVGTKNLEYVVELVDMKLNEIQVREMVQNWPTYESFIRKYVHKSIPFDRFASEIVDQINKHTAPVRILDHIGQLRTTSGTGTTINNPIPIPEISPTPSKPNPVSPVFDSRQEDAEKVVKLEHEIELLNNEPAIKSFLEPASNYVALYSR